MQFAFRLDQVWENHPKEHGGMAQVALVLRVCLRGPLLADQGSPASTSPAKIAQEARLARLARERRNLARAGAKLDVGILSCFFDHET